MTRVFVKKVLVWFGLVGCDVLVRAYHLQQQPLLQLLPGHAARLPGSPSPLLSAPWLTRLSVPVWTSVAAVWTAGRGDAMRTLLQLVGVTTDRINLSGRGLRLRLGLGGVSICVDTHGICIVCVSATDMCQYDRVCYYDPPSPGVG